MGDTKESSHLAVTPDRNDKPLVLSETFGPTIQGEGPSAGRLAYFIRLALCNLDCHWCDTPFTWDWTGKLGHKYDRTTETHHASVGVATDLAHRAGAPLVVITGGEPLIQRTAVEHLANNLCDAAHTVEIETNGTLPPLDHNMGKLAYNVSPKLPGADTTRQPIKPDVFPQWAELARDHDGRVRFKFVITGPTDLQAVDRLADDYALPGEAMWLMPEGRTPDELQASARLVAEHAIDRRWNFSHRLHVLCWGDERGR